MHFSREMEEQKRTQKRKAQPRKEFKHLTFIKTNAQH